MRILLLIILSCNGLHFMQAVCPPACVVDVSTSVASFFQNLDYCNEEGTTLLNAAQQCESDISSECDADNANIFLPGMEELYEQLNNITSQYCGSGDCSEVMTKIAGIGTCLTSSSLFSEDNENSDIDITQICPSLQEIFTCVDDAAGSCDSPIINQTIAPVIQSAEIYGVACNPPLTFRGKQIAAKPPGNNNPGGDTLPSDQCTTQLLQCVFQSPQLITTFQNVMQQNPGDNIETSMVDISQICRLIDANVLHTFITCMQDVFQMCPSLEGSEDLGGISPNDLALYDQMCSCDSLVEGLGDCIGIAENIGETVNDETCREGQRYVCCVQHATRDCPSLTTHLIDPEQQGDSVALLMNQCNVNPGVCPAIGCAPRSSMNIMILLATSVLYILNELFIK